MKKFYICIYFKNFPSLFGPLKEASIQHAMSKVQWLLSEKESYASIVKEIKIREVDFSGAVLCSETWFDVFPQ